MYHKVLHILLLSIGLCLKLQAQAIWSADFPFAEDLPSNEMTDIFQDKEGFIWIGTTHGLARYDGYELHTFQTNQTDTLSAAGLSHDYITGITENDSFLWIGTNKGLNFINKKKLPNRNNQRDTTKQRTYSCPMLRHRSNHLGCRQ